MADYSVSIKLAIAGAKELDRVNKQTEKLRTSINAVNKTAESSGKKPVKNFNNLSKSVTEAREALNEAAIGTKEFNQAVKNLITVENKFNRAQKNKNRALKVEAIRRKEGLTLQQAKNKISKQELELENKLANAKRKTAGASQAKNKSTRFGRGGSFGNAISSGLIGGGFPLLFGQGPTAAIGGGIGGLAGGLIGGQAGFALSIAGTTIGQALDDLATALAKPTENIENLITKLGIAETPTAKLALRLEKLGLKSSAATLLLDEFEEKFGLTTGEIEENTKKMTNFKNKINELGTQITLFLSNVLTPFLEKITAVTKARNKEDNIISLQKQLREQIIATGGDKKSFENQNQMIKKSAQARRKAENLTFSQYQDVLANMYRNILGFDMTKFEPNKNNIINNNLNNNLPNNNLPDPKLQDLEKLADDTFNLQNILPLQQAFEIEKNRFKLTSAELNLQKEKNKEILLEKELTLKIKENKELSTPLLKEEIDILNQKIKNQEQVVKNAETLLEVEELRNKAALTDLDERIKLEKERFKLLPKEIKILQQKNKLSSLESSLTIARKTGNEQLVASLTKQIELQNILINQSMILADPIKAEMISLDQQMKQLTEAGVLVVGLSRTIGSSFQDAFKGVINGTMSVTDAFRSMTNRIANHFLDMAARIMATQIQRSILGIFNPLGGILGGIFGGGGLFGSNSLGINSSGFGSGAMTGNPFRAAGGSVRGGGSYIVGERGPEMFTPGVSGMVTPNNALGGTTNIVVNVDASGSSVEGNESEGKQLGVALSAAIESELVKQKRPGGLLA